MDAPSPPAPAADSPFDYDVAFNIARAVVVANLRYAEATRLAPADLMHELAEEIYLAHARFNPAVASYATFAGTVAHRRLRDRARNASTRSASERGLGGDGLRPEPAQSQKSCGTFFFGGACDEMLLRIPRKLNASRIGRIGHPPRAYAAALIYREEHGLSWWGLRRLIAADAGLRLALGFRQAPSARRLIESRLRLKLWARRNPGAL